MKPVIITIVALVSLISAFVLHADERTLEEVLAENESLQYEIAVVEYLKTRACDEIALVEKEIDKCLPTASIQLPPGMVAVDSICSNLPQSQCITESEYEALQAYALENRYYEAEGGLLKLAQELITARTDLILGTAKEFEVGSEKTSSGFPVSRIEEVRQLSSGLRNSVLLYTQSWEIPEPEGEFATATAFLIQPDLAVTNSHNVRDEQGSLRKGQIVLYTFQGNTVNASVVGDDPGADIALLRLERPLQLPVLKWGDSRNLSSGDPLFTIGHPGRMGSWVTHVGVLEEFWSVEGVAGVNHETISFSAPSMKGSSGSPVFDMNGDVVAVLYATTQEVAPPLSLQLHTSIRFLKKETSIGTGAQLASSLVAEFLAGEGVK